MRIEYDPSESHVFAVDPTRNVVTLDVDDYEFRESPVFEESALEPADADVTDYTHAALSWFSGPPVHIVWIDTATGERRTLSGRGELELDSDTLVQLCSTVRVVVRPQGPGTLERRGTETVVSFDEQTPVTLGWASRVDRPDETVTVPQTPEGIAQYLTVAGCAISDTTPDRTWPNIRDHPPLLEYGEEPDIPDAVAGERPETDVRLLVPREDAVELLAPAAPLVHYLGAEVEIQPGTEPTLDLNGTAQWLGRSPEEVDRTSSKLLRRVFYLDCLARAAGPYGSELPQQPVVPELGLDADSLYEASLVERVQRYLATDYEEVASEFPDWHVGVHLDTTYEQVGTLPYHLARLSDVYCPESRHLTFADRVEWSIEEAFARGPETQEKQQDRPVVEPVQRARTVGWSGPCVGVGAFNATPEAFRNREQYPDADEALRVTVVNNRGESHAEHRSALANYRRRVADLPIMSVESREMVEPGELARIFESHTHHVHYMGHCDENGLECGSGRYLDTKSLTNVSSETFFLNACGTYEQARDLVRKGSVAGAATLLTAKESTATEIGFEWSRLLANGWSSERGLDVARRATDSAGNYVLVGDGAYRPVDREGELPPEIRVIDRDGDKFKIKSKRYAPDKNGIEDEPWPNKVPVALSGETMMFDITKDKLAQKIEDINYSSPLIMDNELVWNPELLD